MPEALRVLFYTCGNHAIGMGHVMRGLVLAHALEAAGEPVEIRFAIEDREAEGTQEIESSGYKTISWNVHDSFYPQVAIIDMPHPNSYPIGSLLKELRSRGCLTVSIDDPGPTHYEADLGFSMLYVPKVLSPSGCRTEQFSGFKYFALCSEFANLPGKQIISRARRILVAQGGSDTYGMTPRICKVLGRMEHDCVIDVLLGPAFKHDVALEESIGGDTRFRIHRRLSALVSVMQRADLAVSAAGITAFELAAVGVPMLLLVSEPKEAETAARLDEQGMAIYLGLSREVSDQILESKILGLLGDQNTRHALSRRCKLQVDGHGVSRTVRAILARVKTIAGEWRATKDVCDRSEGRHRSGGQAR